MRLQRRGKLSQVSQASSYGPLSFVCIQTTLRAQLAVGIGSPLLWDLLSLLTPHNFVPNQALGKQVYCVLHIVQSYGQSFPETNINIQQIKQSRLFTNVSAIRGFTLKGVISFEKLLFVERLWRYLMIKCKIVIDQRFVRVIFSIRALGFEVLHNL